MFYSRQLLVVDALTISQSLSRGTTSQIILGKSELREMALELGAKKFEDISRSCFIEG